MTTRRLTTAQAMVEFLRQQFVTVDGETVPFVAGTFAIFGHGNVAGLGEALSRVQDTLPTYRAHNEQAMAHAAVAYAKAQRRRRIMMCTTSIGPGATNLITAAATAHVNRLPVLLVPGDVFASRIPDPVLQQLEVFGDPTQSVNDCFRPVSRFWDRITRPEQLMSSLPAALRVLLDPAECGPATLSFPQDVQTEAFDYPEYFFEPKTHRVEPPLAPPAQLETAIEIIRESSKPLIIAGGGVRYAGADKTLGEFASQAGIPVSFTQAGKGALPWSHPLNVGGVGVTGTAAANSLAVEADCVLAIGTRLQDFTTASRSLFGQPETKLIAINVCGFDAHKHGGIAVHGDALHALDSLKSHLSDWRCPEDWSQRIAPARDAWNLVVDEATAASESDNLPTDAQVLGAVNRQATGADVVLSAAGGLPGELHKLWRTPEGGGYHLEYGYSCMGYEIAGGLGARLARPEGEVFVMVGDGSYLMLNSEILTSIQLGQKLILVVLDNHGFGCINRLQQACGGQRFNNLLETPQGPPPNVDFVAHAQALGAMGEKVEDISSLEDALGRARASITTYVVVINTDPERGTAEGGAWWDVAVPEVSPAAPVQQAREAYEKARKKQKPGVV